MVAKSTQAPLVQASFPIYEFHQQPPLPCISQATKSCQLRPGHDGNVSMSAGRHIAKKSEYVTDLYTVTTEVID